MLSAIESGARQIHADELVTFAEALRITPAALLGSEDADFFDQGYRQGYEAALAKVHRALAALHPTEENE